MVIKIKQLKCRTVLGVEETERAAPRDVIIDAAFAVDAGPAVDTDDIAHAVDYARLSARIAELAAGNTFHLLETLAARALGEILADDRVAWARVEVEKPGAPPGAAAVSACVEAENTAGRAV